MKKITLILSTVTVLLISVISNAGSNDKITILHKGKEIIDISMSALPAHIEHGDIIINGNNPKDGTDCNCETNS